MTTRCPYRPLGTNVILKILPVENKSTILLPEGKTDPKAHQTFEVVALGGEVNDEKFLLTVGEVVLVAAHPSEFLPLDKELQLVVVNRSKIIAVKETQVQN